MRPAARRTAIGVRYGIIRSLMAARYLTSCPMKPTKVGSFFSTFLKSGRMGDFAAKNVLPSKNAAF